MQPLDVRIFSPAKAEMAKMLQKWREENPGKTIDKYELIRVILPALEKALGNKSLVKEGFKATGLYVEGKGFDPSQVDCSRMYPSEVFVQEETGDNPETGNTAELPSIVPEADVLPPLLPGDSSSLTAPDPVADSHLLSTLSSGSTDDSLLIPVTSDPALSLTSNLSPLVTVTTDTSLPVTRVPAVTEARDITALTPQVMTEPDVPPVTSASVPARVSSDQPNPEDTDTGVSDNPLSQFTIPLEDRIRR